MPLANDSVEPVYTGTVLVSNNTDIKFDFDSPFCLNGLVYRQEVRCRRLL